MSSLSFLNLKNLSKGEQQIFFETKQSMNAKLFKSVYQFQKMVKRHAKYLSYNMSKLPTITQIIDSFDFRPIKQLSNGINLNIQILIKLLRIIRIKENLLCLASDQWSGVSNSYLIVCIMFASSELAQSWHLANGYLCELAAFIPYLNYQSKYKYSFVILKYDNIRVIKSLEIKNKKTSQQIKTIANTYFYKKQYLQALIGYELSLGLLADYQKIRHRSILYANSSQCFYKLKLYQNASIYADAAIIIDPTYIKSIYRKINSLIQLKSNKQIPKLISLAAKYGNQADIKEINQKYNKYIQNSLGLFNWNHIFSDDLLQFNQYLNSKITIQKNEAFDPKYPYYYGAEKEIKKFELLAVMKPLEFYMSANKDEYREARQKKQYFVEKIYFLTILEQRFKSIINKLPRRNFVINQTPESKIEQMCHVNIIVPKNIYPHAQVFGIWPQFYRFRHQCQSNCSYIVINGGLFIFATREIFPSETLTIDYVQTLFKQRYLQLGPKQISICFCSLCNYDWNNFSISKNLIATFEKQKMNSKNSNSKLLLLILWQIILKYDKQIVVSNQYICEQLIKELNNYPQWNIFHNILTAQYKIMLYKRYKKQLIELLMNFLKVSKSSGEQIMNMIIGK